MTLAFTKGRDPEGKGNAPAVITSTDDYYDQMVAEAARYNRPLMTKLTEAVAEYEPPLNTPDIPSGRLVHRIALTPPRIAAPIPLGIIVGVIAQALREEDVEYYFDVEVDHSALLMAREGQPHKVVPVTWSEKMVRIGAANGLPEVVILRGAWDAGERLNQAIIHQAARYFAPEDFAPVRGRRF